VLFRQFEEPICSYLSRLTGDSGRAQELTQETFLRAYRALLKGDCWDNPRAWLYRVASRLATDDYRRRTLLQWLPLWDADRGTDAASRPEELGIEDATAERLAVRAALGALSPKYRVPLVLYVCEECSVAEVAELLDLSVGAVKMCLSRAREMLRQAYQREDVR
jgi:RNA polymerase sigma-70 factor (ECF subfamily)